MAEITGVLKYLCKCGGEIRCNENIWACAVCHSVYTVIHVLECLDNDAPVAFGTMADARMVDDSPKGSPKPI